MGEVGRLIGRGVAKGGPLPLEFPPAPGTLPPGVVAGRPADSARLGLGPTFTPTTSVPCAVSRVARLNSWFGTKSSMVAGFPSLNIFKSAPIFRTCNLPAMSIVTWFFCLSTATILPVTILPGNVGDGEAAICGAGGESMVGGTGETAAGGGGNSAAPTVIPAPAVRSDNAQNHRVGLIHLIILCSVGLFALVS